MAFFFPIFFFSPAKTRRICDVFSYNTYGCVTCWLDCAVIEFQTEDELPHWKCNYLLIRINDRGLRIAIGNGFLMVAACRIFTFTPKASSNWVRGEAGRRYDGEICSCYLEMANVGENWDFLCSRVDLAIGRVTQAQNGDEVGDWEIAGNWESSILGGFRYLKIVKFLVGQLKV